MGVRAWSSLVMTPASHAGNPEFESRRAYAFLFFYNFFFFLPAVMLCWGFVPDDAAFDTLPEWLRGSPAK